jgi:hypothetical protein
MSAMRALPQVFGVALVVWGLAVAGTGLLEAQQAEEDGPRYSGSALLRPDNYREWVFVSSGLGMAYGPNAAGTGRPPVFTNVFVNPRSYRQFMATGAWPDRTMFVLEVRASSSQGSINKGGNFQAQVVGMEAEVKDSRAPGGWTFFDFANGGAAPTGEALPQSASCYGCHKANAAVENTFVQFYPNLMEVARRKGTVNAGYHDEATPVAP